MERTRLLLRDDPLTNLADQDRFRHTAYESVLKQILEDVDPPFTIGLFGSWGTGKSTIVGQLRRHYHHEKNSFSAFVNLDVWRFQIDSFRRQILLALEKELKDQEAVTKSDIKAELKKRTVEVRGSLELDWLGAVRLGIALLATGVIAAALFFLFRWAGAANPELAFLSLLLAPAVLQVLNRIPEMMVRQEGTVTTLPPVAADEFESLFRDPILTQLEKHYISKVVTVVDNLDRLQSGQVVEVLGSIKTFMEVPNSPFVFVVPCDDEAIRSHIASQYFQGDSEEGKEYASQFLRKFFNVTIPVSSFYEDEMRAFAEEELRKVELGAGSQNHEIRERLAKMVAVAFPESPRRVKQFLNNLAARVLVAKARMEDGILNLDEQPFEPLLLAKLMVIEDKWPDVAKDIRGSPGLFQELQAEASASATDDSSKAFAHNPGLRRFLLATEDVSAPAGTVRAYLVLKQTKDEASLPDYEEFREAAEAGKVSAVMALFSRDPSLADVRLRVLAGILREVCERGQAGQSRFVLTSIVLLAEGAEQDQKVVLAGEVGAVMREHGLPGERLRFVPAGPLMDLLASSPRQEHCLSESVNVLTKALTQISEDFWREGPDARREIGAAMAERLQFLSAEQRADVRESLEKWYAADNDMLLAVTRNAGARAALISPVLVKNFAESVTLEGLRSESE